MSKPISCSTRTGTSTTIIFPRCRASCGVTFPLAQIIHLRQAGDELAITFATHDLTMRGKSLDILHKEICRYRVAVVRVGESKDGVTITAIEVKEVGA